MSHVIQNWFSPTWTTAIHSLHKWLDSSLQSSQTSLSQRLLLKAVNLYPQNSAIYLKTSSQGSHQNVLYHLRSWFIREFHVSILMEESTVSGWLKKNVDLKKFKCGHFIWFPETKSLQEVSQVLIEWEAGPSAPPSCWIGNAWWDWKSPRLEQSVPYL